MEPTAELLLRYDKPGPRYTSYPTAPVWSGDLPASELDDGLATLGSPASVYVHVPFCEEQCIYCACNMVVARNKHAGVRYLAALDKQVASLALPDETVVVERIHLGGGTPTWLDPDQLRTLYQSLFTRFHPVPGAELSVEADPEVTTDDHLDALAELGVTRLSLGVQSLDPVVLEAIRRPQRADRVAHLLERARGLGMRGLNLDLVYGLPFQTPDRMRATLDGIVEMRPDRISLFGYAHVPWLKPHQRQMPEDALPGPVERMELFLLARRRLQDCGYVPIGLDHFALPDDELALALGRGELHRSFMGYTTRPDLELVGLGPSAISELRDRYVQQRTKLGAWYRAVEEDGNVVEKGMRLSPEDRLRGEVIERILCNLVVPYADVEARHDVDFGATFSDELASLAPLEDDGLVERRPDRLQVTPLGRLLVRNVAMAFDGYLGAGRQERRYSRTV